MTSFTETYKSELSIIEKEKILIDNEKKQEKVPKPFVYECDEHGNLKMFTFITTNPSVMYGELQTRCVRVMYTLKPDIENKGECINRAKYLLK